MSVQWQPFREPLRNTLLRTGLIALAGGAALAYWWGGIARWPIAFLIVLWFSLGGHFVELFFLNFLRPRLPASRPVHVAARLAVWFAGGTILVLGMAATAGLANANVTRWPFWYGGLAFIGVELVAHLGMYLRRLPNFYNGRG